MTETRVGITHILGDIIQNIWLQRHVDVNSPGNPAQLALAHIQHAVDLGGRLAANDCAVPSCLGHSLHGRPDLRQPQEVCIGILLLVAAAFLQLESIEWLVMGLRAVERLCRRVAAARKLAGLQNLMGLQNIIRGLLEQLGLHIVQRHHFESGRSCGNRENGNFLGGSEDASTSGPRFPLKRSIGASGAIPVVLDMGGPWRKVHGNRLTLILTFPSFAASNRNTHASPQNGLQHGRSDDLRARHGSGQGHIHHYRK